MTVLRLFFYAIWRLLWVVGLLLKWGCKYTFRGVRWLLRPRPITHGSARWARLGDLTQGDALGGEKGVIVGKAWGHFIRFKRDGAVMVTAPMGKGKGVGIVIPNLLDHKGSMLVTDPKGENYAVTQRYRSSLGPVYRLDAIHPDHSHSFNPLDMIRVGTLHEADDAAQIANFLVINENRDGHWDTSARLVMTALIRHVLHSQPPELRTLSMCRELIAGGDERVRLLLTQMAESNVPSVAEEGRVRLAGLEFEETTSVIGNTAKALAFWSKDRIGGRLSSASDFSMMDLNREGMTVYVMVPDDQIEVYGPFLRMMTGCALAALMRGKALPRPEYKPMLMIDECKALGRLDALAKGMGMLREYAHVVHIWQDHGQLNELYGENGAQTFIAASGAQVTFGISDTKTAKQLAEDVGRTTVYSRSHGFSEGNLDLVQAQLQNGVSETGRYLKDAAEMRRINPNQCVITLQDQVGAPILANKVKYYEEWCWRGRYDEWRSQATILNFPSPRPRSDADDMPSVA
ncbi:type IV secretory system conjugative DNA transfer family protein [Methylorubrum thiocyanatum]|jgi:type IV secretion system protein VirD4|uniref:Type IV secretion system protein VirD4 n=1 Tax=Methylorubrum thiocyanatum TaxID=47958 RepID=A0AA40S7U9_9HYPH|nr:type IV secretory system conjugative DNA transfer family protein [Methylorubrum thiocyanatum]MBA8916158.1 type IV secretion system protein VirD4 [Methylorubrum thiocyanatum]GJE79997.1 Protein VirD4 [Methylorubrum thiocyanatum]